MAATKPDHHTWPPHTSCSTNAGDSCHLAHLIDTPLLTQQVFADLPIDQVERNKLPARYHSLNDVTNTLTAATAEWNTIHSVFARFKETTLDREADIDPDQLSYLASQGPPSEYDVRSSFKLSAVHSRDHAQRLTSVLDR